MPTFLRRLALPFALAGSLAGCASMQSPMEVKNKTVSQTDTAKKGPEAAPHRSITGFSAALRCMDNLLVDYGVRDLSMLVEEILDQTKKVNAGTRDMLITAMSDMTRRSRAVRVVAFGKDAGNAVAFLQAAQRMNAYQVIPQYDIKGSVTQLDENVIRNQKDAGIGFTPFINLGISRDAAASILGLDLTMLFTEDMSVMAGVTSRNSVVILKQGKGFDGDAAYHKFGISYSMNLNKSEGQTQALRGLVELAVIELVGKLTKIPYWSCLGGDPKTSEEIRTEMSDWYYAMASRSVEIIGYFQNQLRRRGFYQGPIDGRFNPAIDEAIGNYRQALGLSKEAVIDEAFFNAFLTADHSKIKAPAQPAVAQVAPDPAPQPVQVTQAVQAAREQIARHTAPSDLVLAIASEGNRSRYQRGELVKLQVLPNRDAYVTCYLQDENARITRFYPNRFLKDPLVASTRPLSLPGNMRFQIVMNGKGMKETVACFAAPRDVLGDLPEAVVGNDFEPLKIGSFQPIREAFAKATGGTFAQGTFEFAPR
jgi:hypothetical protein